MIKIDKQATQLELKLHAIQINEFQIHKKSIQVQQYRSKLKTEKYNQFLKFTNIAKSQLYQFAPFGVVSAFAGILIVKSLIYGSMSGLMFGSISWCLYKQLQISKDQKQ